MKKTLLFLILFGFVTLSEAQILKPITWEVALSNATPTVGEEVTISFKAQIEDNWYLYSSDFDPDLGPLVTEFIFHENDTYALAGELTPINPKKKYDSLWEGEYTYFKKEGLFQQKVKILKKEFTITGEYLYQVCSDIDGKCIPFEDEFSLGSKKKNR